MKDLDQWDLLQTWIAGSSRILIKKLSRNDCSWADDPRKHQNGFYVPAELRPEGFFPPLLPLTEPGKEHIYVSEFTTIWPATGEVKHSNIRHFSNKGAEVHLTRVPKDEFAGLTPASLLIGGKLSAPMDGGIQYWFVTVDSASADAELLETLFELGADFTYALFDPRQALSVPVDEGAELIKEIDAALRAGTLAQLLKRVSILPTSEVLAENAQSEFLKAKGLERLDPYEIPNPGDAIMEISRDIEFVLYKRAELRHRAVDVVRILTDNGQSLANAVVRGFPALDASFLSASQHRKSRAGRSFEHHIGRLLRDGNISFEEQVITGGRRPDFVLPSKAVLNSDSRAFNDALVLSAKTTLRERWKQITLENADCGLFLATVDDRVSSEAIEDMRSRDIFLVVPESLKKADTTCYAKKPNVLSFREFFDIEITQKRPVLRAGSAARRAIQNQSLF
ncbi:type II restriction endonuclease [Pseudomonas neustonica]|uniref:type II restriction endonuclease n=1 Tax=Pseudomonas neustonica TaxID=2487346 RepID=UPI003F472130